MTHRARPLIVVAFVALVAAADPANLAAQTASPQTFAPPSTATSASPGASIQDLITDTIDDFRQIPSWPNLQILIIGGIAATAEHAGDRDISNAMASSNLGSVLHSGQMLGGARSQLAVALGTYTIGRISRSAKVSAIGADLISSQILSQTMTSVIKTSVGRTRPDGTEYSFPSGHASSTFATATVLQRHLGWKVGLPAYGFATFVAAQRVQSKRHFLSDVTFGAAIGIVAGRSVTIGSGNAKFAVAPAAAPGGASINFNWLGKN